MKAMPLHRDGIRELRKASSELKRRLEAGEPLRVEELLERYPRLAENEEAVLELIHAEVMTRNELGQRPSLEEWQRAVPAAAPQAGGGRPVPEHVRVGDADAVGLVGRRPAGGSPAGRGP